MQGTSSNPPTILVIKFTLQATAHLLTGRSAAAQIAKLADLTGETPKNIENALKANLMTSGLESHVQGLVSRAQSLQDALDLRDEEDAAREDFNAGLAHRAAALADEKAAPAPKAKKS